MELSLERGQRPLRDIPTAMQRIKKSQLHKKQQQEARSKEWGEGFNVWNSLDGPKSELLSWGQRKGRGQVMQDSAGHGNRCKFVLSARGAK